MEERKKEIKLLLKKILATRFLCLEIMGYISRVPLR